MALIKCTKCGQMVSEKAVKCPRCGLAIKDSNTQKTPPLKPVRKMKMRIAQLFLPQ